MESSGAESRRRLVRFYVALAAFVLAGTVITFVIGSGQHAERSIAGTYEPIEESRCLGRSFDLRQSGQFAWLSNPDETTSGTLRVRKGIVTGTVSCRND